MARVSSRFVRDADDDPDGDGIPNRDDDDIDNDGIPNDQDVLGAGGVAEPSLGDIPDDPVDAAQWLEDNIDSMSESQLQAAQDFFEGQALLANNYDQEIGQAWVALADAASTGRVDGLDAGQTVLDEATATGEGPVSAVQVEQSAVAAQDRREDAIEAVAQIVANAQPGSQVDMVAEIENSFPGAFSESEVNEIILLGTQQGTEDRARENPAYSESPELAQAMAAQEVSSLFLDAEIPLWIRQLASEMGALDPETGDLKPEELQQFADYYNWVHGTTLSVDQILKQEMAEQTENNLLIAEAALSDTDPVTPFTVSVPDTTRGSGRRDVTVSQDQVARLYALGYSAQDIVRLTRTAEMFGDESRGDSPGAVDLRVWGLGALARATGQWESYEAMVDRQEELQRMKQELAELQSQGGPGLQERLARQRELRAKIRFMEQAIAKREMAGAGAGLIGLQSAMNIGMDRYGDGALAFIHAIDSSLASRLADTGGDPEKMDQEDAREAYDMLVAGGFYEVDPLANPSAIMLGQLDDYFSMRDDRDAGGGTVARVLDTVAASERIRQQWQAMFFSDPSSQFVQGMVSELQSQLSAAPPGQEFDVLARISKMLGGTPEYQELYGNKPAGMSDEMFQGQFLAASETMLGSESPDLGAIRAGMRQDNFQTTIGSIAGSGKAWQNSRFLGRFARAGQVVSEMT